MPLFGAHLSVAGGLSKAVDAAVALGMQTVQIFTHSPSQWVVKPTPDGRWEGKELPEDEVTAFRQAAKKAKLKFLTAHDSYLINLAAPTTELYEKSIAAFGNELDRAESLGLAYLVTHPGAHVGSGEDAGLAKVAAALNVVHRQRPDYKVKVLLELTAGQGSSLGARFEHFAYLLENVEEPDRLGICLDTCHVFAAGYDLRTDAAYDATFAEFDRLIGLKWLKLFHVNDSLKPLGSRVDRHAGIGLGQIGDHAFRRLVTDPRFRTKPMILETPKEDAAGNPMDPVNLGKLQAFLAETAG
ncbi:deoxyribonuclease IV [Limnoglobus roseus]|uniref:Probable endonuclease 4 n=1 Tax=Limnoglobus roseus TaxID=2598579 RepID=A0A5C1AM86_9BACT|nr:deoxyribonuclease IV [Limnoglobus roseus]QEL20070.1 deoxyribonuclease IV [Limnoglobus roseus]